MSDSPLKVGDRIEVYTLAGWEPATVAYFLDDTVPGRSTLGVVFDVPRLGWSYKSEFIVEASRVRPMKADTPHLVDQPA